MKNIRLLSLLLILTLFFYGFDKEKYSVKIVTDKNGYKYETVENDPLKARIYTLKNGLKVYLTVNKDKPEIQTFIAIRAGSTFDPPGTTGLAHYLEHMLFKGTSKIGSLDWEKEKELLDQISDQYEEHLNTDDTNQKRVIYAKIDSLSTIAGRYVIASEYEKMASSLGARYTNAFTSDEQTAYMNNIPTNQLEKWLILESERFSQLVLRLFHTELEAVYEEFNMSQDNDNHKALIALKSGLFQKHPYGTQTVIGKAEHLKNPSMVNIHNYFNTYYVANNMAICMSGDFNPEETIVLIDKYFGKLKTNPKIPKFKRPQEDPITAPVIKEVLGPDKEFVRIGFRFEGGANSKDDLYLTLIDHILNNSQAGLVDLNLIQEQKVLGAGTYTSVNKDYSFHVLWGKPRKEQTLEQVKDLLLGEIEKIKNGEFEDWLIEAVINDLRLSKIRMQESNWRVTYFISAFTNSVNWIDYVNFLDRVEKITKEELIQYVKEHYTNNYVVVFKRTGVHSDVVKVEKPQITPAEIRRDTQSIFYQDFAKIETEDMKPVFLDFKEKIVTEQLNSGINISYIKNTTNKLFSLNYIIDMGKYHIEKLRLAVNYIPYLGTDKYSPAELQQEFYKYGLDMGVYAGDERSYVYISGLEKSFEKGVELMEHVLANIKPSQQSYDDYIDGIIKKRADAKLDKRSILWNGMYNYGKYGKVNPFTNIISEEELRIAKPEELTDLIKEIYSYKHKLFYYGQRDLEKVKTLIDTYHKIPKNLKDYPQPIKYVELPADNNKVYFVNYDMVQTNIIMLAKDELLNIDLFPTISLFNEYYGGSMASIVFQEIRESRALAYSAYASYTTPWKPDRSHYTYAFVGTSPGKLKMATTAMLELMNDMPKAEKQFDLARESIIKKLETQRIIKSSIFWTYQSNLDKGIDYDIRKDVYEKAKSMTLHDIETFFSNHIKDKKFTFLILGNKDDIDMNILKELGEFQELSLEEVFNY